MPVKFDQSVECQIDVTLLEAARVLSVLVQAAVLQIEMPKIPDAKMSWEIGDLESNARWLVRDAVKSRLLDSDQPQHDDLDLAVRSRMDQNRALFELPKRLDFVLQEAPKPVEVTLDAEFAYPSTCAALLDAFKVLNHPRLTFVLNGTAQEFVRSAGIGYGNLDKARHNAARLGIRT